MKTNSPVEWKKAADLAARRIPPLWPLKHFVAVNPFLEMIDEPFSTVAKKMERMVPGGILVEKSFYLQKYVSGEISDTHLGKAITIHSKDSSSLSVQKLSNWLKNSSPRNSQINTLAEAIDQLHKSRWEHEVVDEISNWLGAYLDDGQAIWAMPWKDQPLFQAWKEAASIDRNPEMLGLKKFRSFVSALPSDPSDAILNLIESSQMDVEDVSDWLYRTILSVGGWASCLQYRNRSGQSEDGPLDLLAIRLAFDVALLKQYDSETLRAEWDKKMHSWDKEAEKDLDYHLIWQEAFELSYREPLIEMLSSSIGQEKLNTERPFAQMVFCIDVRSEPLRRSIEKQNKGITTYGYAGFFGMPIEKVPFANESGAPHCPVILDPPYKVREGVHYDEAAVMDTVQRERGLAGLWKSFKDSAVSSFSFVEAAGLKYAWTLTKDSFSHRNAKILNPSFTPIVDTHDCDHTGACGIPSEDQVTLAKGVVNALNLDQRSARLIVLCGHGASTTNNPYDSGYQCGACGGHSGDFNSRLAVEIMNREEIRRALKGENLALPDDTVFVAGRHDTTLDQVYLFDEELIPKSHNADLKTLKNDLEEACRDARINRAPQLGIHKSDVEKVHAEIEARAGDWSQVRPEWGLAGNASFIIAPRETTVNLDLEGRAFLHHYESDQDSEGGLLASILGGPMVVGSWINLQYYASAVNQDTFGSGHKTLHNVNGAHGVQLGNGGDLKTGLAFQSVHDGEKLVHEPSKLHVFVDAPEDKVLKAVASNESVKQLVKNGWLHLFFADGSGGWTKVV